tara:strand:+ start:5426 stop:5890 length:465 start_codon:yes stop_codon:yes gene_type:complete
MSAFSYADRAFYPPPVQPFTSPPNPILDALAALARYIPAEGLALYIAIAAFAAQIPWLVVVGLIAALALTALIVIVKWADARSNLPESERPSGRMLALTLVVILVALVIYVSALAGNPVTSGFPNGTVVGGVAVLIAAAFLSILGPRMGLERRS